MLAHPALGLFCSQPFLLSAVLNPCTHVLRSWEKARGVMMALLSALVLVALFTQGGRQVGGV